MTSLLNKTALLVDIRARERAKVGITKKKKLKKKI